MDRALRAADPGARVPSRGAPEARRRRDAHHDRGREGSLDGGAGRRPPAPLPRPARVASRACKTHGKEAAASIMRFGLVHRIMTDALAALGLLALVTSGELDRWIAGGVVLGLCLSLLVPE